MRSRLLIALGFLPLVGVVLLGGLAAALPEDVLWLNAAKATLLSVARWVPLLWLPWAVMALRARSWVAGLLGITLAGAGFGIPALDTADGPGLVIVAANVQAYADGAEALEADLAALRADVVLTHERRGERVAGMRRVADNDDRPLPRPSHGAAVYCREGLACEARITDHIGPQGCAMPLALARVEARLCVVGVHAPPPAPICAEGLRPYVDEIAAHIDAGRITESWPPCLRGDAVVVTGDLNYVPASHVHRALLAKGLRDPAWARGVFAASWPAGGGWPDLPLFRLDHVLAGAVDVEGVRFVRLSGSDHKAVRFRARPRTPLGGS